MVKGLFAPEQRRIRIETIKNQIIQSLKDINFIKYDKFVLVIMENYGFTKSKSKEYIDTAMELSNTIISIEGEIINGNK